MKQIPAAVFGLALVMGVPALAQETATAPAPSDGQTTRFDATVRDMQKSLDQIKAATDPGERLRLLREHMQITGDAMRTAVGHMPGYGRGMPPSRQGRWGPGMGGPQGWPPGRVGWPGMQGPYGGPGVPAPGAAPTPPEAPISEQALQQRLTEMQQRLDKMQQVLQDVVKYKEPIDKLLQQQGATVPGK